MLPTLAGWGYPETDWAELAIRYPADAAGSARNRVNRLDGSGGADLFGQLKGTADFMPWGYRYSARQRPHPDPLSALSSI